MTNADETKRPAPSARDMNHDGRVRFLAPAPTGGAPGRDERAELDSLVDLLASPVLWAEPRPELEDIVVADIAAAVAELGQRVTTLALHRRIRRRRPVNAPGIRRRG